VDGLARLSWLDVPFEGHNLGIADSSAFRTGYISLLLPASTGDLELRSTIRNMVIDALAATGEWPARLRIVTSKLVDSGDMKRWFVEYETGPVGEAVELADGFD
jgi:hypothetical protein